MQPGTVRQLAARAGVGMRNARYTCSRLVSRGELVALKDCRPVLLGRPSPERPGDAASAGAELAAVLVAWRR